jgi:hypothetical protein
MQIHEITLLQEGLGTMVKQIGSDLKSAVVAPLNKARAVLDTPGSLTSARGYQAAKDRYYTDLVGQRKQADLTAWAKKLSGEWLKQSRPSSQTPVATTPTVPTTAAPTVPTAPTNNYKSPFVPYGVPNPAVPVTAATPTPPAAVKKRTGGKQPGVVSQTPNAIRQRNSRAAAAAPGQDAFGQMSQTLSGANKSTSSTGGTTTKTPTGLVHTAKSAAAAPAAATASKTSPKWLTPNTKISQASADKPTADEYAKLQQRIAAADAAQQAQTNEAFSDLPGPKPTAGGTVPASATARPAGIKAPPPLQSRYAQNFKTWAASKVADKSSGLGLTDVEKMPDMTRTLNQALAQVVTTQQDSKANQSAVEQYLLMVGQAMQKLSAGQKKAQQQGSRKQVSALTPLSSVLNPSQIEDLKTMAKDPYAAREIKTALGLK